MDIFAIVIILIAYFIPAIIAWVRHHHNENAITALNLFLGWTVLGWVAAFIWSLTYVPARNEAEEKR